MALLLALQATGPSSGDPGYEWSTAYRSVSVQFGLAESDDRALRIDCDDGVISVFGPSGVDGRPGEPVDVAFTVDRHTRRYEGVLTELGDGLNFRVELPGDALLLTGLAEGKTATVRHGDASWDISGDGAATHIGRILAVCEAGPGPEPNNEDNDPLLPILP